MKVHQTLLALTLLSLTAATPAWSAGVIAESAHSTEVPAAVKDVGITEKLGASVGIGQLRFTDESGKEVLLSQYFESGKPVLLNLGYYGCPMLCSLVLNGMTDGIKNLEWTPGREYEVVTLSIDPSEGHELAAKKKANYLRTFGRAEAATGWHFLTGKEDQIRKLADQVGWNYKRDEKTGEYAHGAALIALTPDGRVSRYLYGITFQPKDLKLALLEASNGKIGTVIERLLLFCYRYDPQTRKYSVYLNRVMQAGGAGTIVAFGGYLAIFWRGQRRRTKKKGV